MQYGGTLEITYKPVTLKLNQTFRISRGECNFTENIFVYIDDGRVCGIGEVCFSKRYGENMERVREFLDRIDPAIHLSGNPLHVKDTILRLESVEPLCASALAGCDMAIYDLAGKISAKPLWELLSLSLTRHRIVAKTLPINREEQMVEDARSERGSSILKIKFNNSLDPGIIKKINDVSGSRIWIDVNEGWGVDEAIDKIKYFEKFDFVELIEQPIRAGNPDGIERIRANTNCVIILDEDIKTIDDVKLYSTIAHGINVKLMKCGGILKSLEIITEARKRNMKIMLGCMLESAVGISAASHLLSLVDYVDIDSIRFIEDDLYYGSQIMGDIITVPSGYGIGVVKREDVH